MLFKKSKSKAKASSSCCETEAAKLISSRCETEETSSPAASSCATKVDVSSLPAQKGDARGRDVVIVGSGAAGFSAALKAVELGAKVTMIERSTVGGTCVNVGCVPSKFLIRAAEAYHGVAHPNRGFPFISSAGGKVDFRALSEASASLVEMLRREKYENVQAATEGFALRSGDVTFTGENSLRVGDDELTFDKLLIATGTRPSVPPIPGLADGPYLTSTTALELKELPERLIVLGTGYIGLELAQGFARLGAKVVLVARKDRLLGGIDDDVTRTLMDALVSEGVEIITNATVASVSYGQGRAVLVHLAQGERGGTLEGSHILVTTGREPNLPDGLDRLGVRLEQGHIAVDEHMRTNNPNVYAAGDVVKTPAFVYVAAYEGGLAAQNMLNPDSPATSDYRLVSWVVFTEPQVAGVGIMESEARAQGVRVDVSTLPLSALPRALVSGDTRGFLKLIKAAGEDRLLGAIACMPAAGDIIMQVALAMRFNMSVKELSQTMHPYLTYSEAIKLCAQGFFKDVKKLSCCA